MTKRRLTPEPPAPSVKRPNLGNSIFCNVADAIHDANNRLASGDIADDEIIQLAEPTIDDLQDLCASIRVARATAFRRKGMLEKALQEASKAIKARPCSPQGYLITSELYSTQGHCKSAIKVLEDGLRAVLPSDYPTLYDKREEAKQSMEAKVDFVLKLPPEISHRIFGYINYFYCELRTWDMFECIAVSKSWRASVLKCPEAWDAINMFDDYAFKAPTPLFQSISSFIKDLDLSVDDSKYVKLCAMASNGMFRSVEKLLLFGSCTLREVSQFITFTTIIAPQLTHLHMNISRFADYDWDISLPLDLILTACKNLKRLSLESDGNEESCVYSVHDSARLAYPLNLENLDIRSCNHITHIVEWLIPQCPRLKYLAIQDSELFSILHLLDIHCPDLKELALGGIHSLPESSTHNGPQRGLQRISCSIYTDDEARGWTQNLALLILKGKDTLEAMKLEFKKNEDSVEELWNSLANVRYSCLTELHLSRDATILGGAWSDSIPRLLHQCPMLTTVELNIKDKVPDNFFASLIELRHLQKLTLWSFQSCGSLAQFLNYHSSLAQRSTLQDIGILECPETTDDILDAVARITTLRQIALRGPFLRITKDGMSQFLHKLTSNTNLEALRMYVMPHLSQNSGKELESISDMERSYNKENVGKPSLSFVQRSR